MTSPRRINEKRLGIFAPRPSSGSLPLVHSKGFTLLEIVIVLAVSALIIGGAITTVILSSAERKLKDASGEIELLAKKARTASILHQTPYAIQFGPDFVRIRPFVETTEINRLTALGNEIGGTVSDSQQTKVLREEIEIDPDIELTIRHWNSSEYIRPTENLLPVWRFDPDGLSEPLTVRLVIGDNYAMDTYHPLTAAISESELEAK